jgi:hypothetical protein
LERDLWADRIWIELWKVHPHGLNPKELRDNAGLTSSQVLMGVRYLRDLFIEDKDTPVVYVRAENMWYVAPSWTDHVRQHVRTEFLQQSAKRMESAVKELRKAERAFPLKARQIRKIARNATYLREETEDLIEELA